jgi:hypothetical protein
VCEITIDIFEQRRLRTRDDIVRLIAGGSVACLTWLLTRSVLLGSLGAVETVNLTGVLAIALVAGYFASDLLLRAQTYADDARASRTSSQPADPANVDTTVRAAAEIEVEKLRRRRARAPNDLAIARELIVALRAAERMEEALHVSTNSSTLTLRTTS